METSFTLTGFDFDRVLYRGTNTMVYAGRRLRDARPVVVKIAADEDPRPKDTARLQREYELGLELNLAGVVRPLALEKHGNGFALVLEDFGGVALSAVLRDGGMAVDEFLEFALQVTSVLGEIHARNVIHKDVKPANIIVDRSLGKLKVTDFGIASRLSREEQNLRSPGALEGTLAYMSPEQTGRMNRSLDYRSDFYSLGATFYEMLTGKTPFASRDPMELVHCHIARNPAPPEEVRADIPPGLSKLVMKLLAKTAEERYQSSFGLRSDLETCRRRLREAGEIPEFELGTLDRSEQFRIRQKLYGRESEIETLLSSFGRVREGESRLMLVAGYSGIGKSALVNEVQRPVVESHAYFISGKFDQFKRDIPYSAVIQAFQELARQLLTEEPERIAGWKESLLEALGSNGGVIVDVIPEIELIMGEQPPVARLGPTEAQNRFNLVFRNFVGVFARKEHPLVIFLDDLQWADAASLKLIHLLMTDVETGHLLMLGAYRDNEVDGSHPMMGMLDDLRKNGREHEAIFLGPLIKEHVLELTGDALSREGAQVESLADLTMEKTGGNPFFVSEFLKELYKKNLLNLDAQTGQWTWDTKHIKSMAITDNVVHLLSSKIMELGEATREVLKLASCVGSRFDLKTLAIVHEKTPDETANDLREALVEGLVVPLADEYKYVGSEGSDGARNRRGEFHVAYRFLHDRVQQAAYSLIPESEKNRTHLAIGRHIRQGTPPEELEEVIFDIVNHMNIGAALISEPEERLEAARLNSRAGRKAKKSTAYEPAARYLNAGMDMIGANGWDEHYELMLDLHVERADAENLRADYEGSERMVDAILDKGRDVLDRARGFEIRIRTLNARNQLTASLDTARRVLRTLGVVLPENAKQHHVLIHMARAKIVIALKGERSLLKASPMKDSRKLAAMRILNAIGSTAYQANNNLFAVILLTMTRLSYRYGNAPSTPFGISLFAMAHAGVLQQFQKGIDFGKLALELVDNPESMVVQSKTVFVYNCFVRHWRYPVQETFEGLMDSARIGLESGDLEYFGYGLQVRVLNKLYSTPSLNEVLEEAHRFHEDLSNHYGSGMPYYIIKIWSQQAENLAGQAPVDTEMQGSFFKPDDYLPMFEKTGYLTAIIGNLVCRATLLSFLGEHERALADLEKAFEQQEAIMCLVLMPALFYHYSLAMTALFNDAPAATRRKYIQRIRRNQKQLLKWRNAAPMNQGPRYVLVEAELARIRGRDARAMKLYAEAIALARENEVTQDEALANERASAFYLQLEQDRAARGHMREAYYLYEKWGAEAKTRRLRETYDYLDRGTRVEGSGSITVSETASTTTARGSALDLSTIIKATRAISGEIRLEKLLDRLMLNILENAGGNRGVLFLERDGILTAAARKTAESETVAVNVPLEECEDVPRSLINYVARTRENLVLSDAAHEEKFAGDPYMTEARPRSILCSPIMHHGRPAGLIYLENNLVAGAFTPERLEVLLMLGSQAAVSLENAQLYGGLEDKVEERTAELRTSKREIDDILANVGQGLLTINRRGEINAEYSARVVEIFKRDDLGGLNFANLFVEYGEIRERVAAYIDELFTNAFMSAELFDAANPLREIHYGVVDDGRSRIEKVLSFSFKRIRGAAGVEKAMVVIDDHTTEFCRRRELEERADKQTRRMENLHHILLLPPETLSVFIRESLIALENTDTLLNDLGGSRDTEILRESFRVVHTLKGEAGALNLDSIAAAAHVLEDRFEALQNSPDSAIEKAAGEEFTSKEDASKEDASKEDASKEDARKKAREDIAAGLNDLREEIRDGSNLFERVIGMQKAIQDSSSTSRVESGDYFIEFTERLRALAEKSAEELGKSVELLVRGEVKHDNVLRSLRGSLTHIVRNAVAHGLEDSAERERGGKPETGRIVLEFLSREGRISVSCEDDGAGLNGARIRSKALEKNLITAQEAASMSASELHRLLFLPGFSTAERVTNASGRGVGMDAVREDVRALGGRIILKSKPGAYTRFTIEVPEQ